MDKIRNNKISIIVLLLWLIIAVCFNGCVNQSTNDVVPLTMPTPGRNGVLNYDSASRRTVADFPLLYLKGTPYERGYQYGVLMRDEINDTISRVKERINNNNADWGNVWDQAYQLEANMPGDLIEKINGLTDGCGNVYYRDILLINTIFGIEMCTAAALKVNGEYIHIKNTDLSYVEEIRPMVLTVEEDSDGNRMLVMTERGAGRVTPTNGINDRGISLTGNSMPFYEKEIDTSSRMFNFVLRYQILARCSQMSEVEALVQSFPTLTSRGFVVTSAFENLAAKFEINPETCGKKITYRENIYQTNFFTTNTMRAYQSPDGFFDSHCSFMNGKPTCSRYRLLEQWENHFILENDRDAIAILRDITYFYDNNEYMGAPVVDADIYGQTLTPDDVHGWFFSYYDTINNSNTQFTLIMNPNQGYLYFAAGQSFAAYNQLTKVDMRGEVNDDWNINTDVIEEDEEGQRREAIYRQFLIEIRSGGRGILEISQDYLAQDENNVAFYESYGRALLTQDVEEAMNFFEETSGKFSSNMFIKRLYGISIFEVYKINKNPELLSKASEVYEDILDTLNISEITFPGLQLDILYRLMLIAKEENNIGFFEKWETRFNEQYHSLGKPDYYPFSVLTDAVNQLK